MYSSGVLMAHVLQWTQFDLLIWSFISTPASAEGSTSYTFAGQNRVSGAANFLYETLMGVDSIPGLIFR